MSGSLRMQGQVPGGLNPASTKKTPLNADRANNLKVLGGEEWEDLFENSMEITGFNGFSCNGQMKIILFFVVKIKTNKDKDIE